jgi:hypothetical protein
MHPVTRLGRVVQQLRSFGDLHATELDALATELDAAGLSDLASKVRVFRDLQRDEGQLVSAELADIQSELMPVPVEDAPPAEPGLPAADAWQASPKRAAWLAEREKARQPKSRRDFLRRGGPSPT